MAASEPFPLLNTSVDQLHSGATDHGSSSSARRRRKSSEILADTPNGDLGAPGLATTLAHMNGAQRGQYAKDAKDSASPSKRFSKRRKARSLLRRAKHFTLRHTWVLPLAILLVILGLYAANPSPSNPTHAFIFLSYRLPSAPGSTEPTQYGKGLKDIALVAFYVVVLSFTREFVMQELLRPLSRWCGLSRAKQARFTEQMYQALYFATVGPAGMWVMSRTPVWYFNTAGMYSNFPHWTHAAEFKFYYLFQAAFWAQQAIVLVLGMEKPRKDFKELVGHHIVSLALIALSYRFHFTYMGLAVYITHDISDFFLATSKILNYIDHPAQGPYFFFFMCVWIYMRHYLNLSIIWSLFTEYETIGPFELDWAGGQFKCRLAQVITFSLLAFLQALNLFWLFFILRIAYRFVVLHAADDDRSEYEPSADEAEAEAEDQEDAAQRTGREESRPPVLLNGGAGAGVAAARPSPPEVLLNGEAIVSNGSAHTNGSATKRSAAKAR